MAATKLGAGEPATFFRALPAPRSLRTLADSMLAKQGASRRSAPVFAAIGDLEKLVEACGGSFAKLRARLAEDARLVDDSASSVQLSVLQKGIHKHAAQLMGHSVGVILNMMITRPIPDNPEHTETIGVNGLIGLESTSGPIPLVFRNLKFQKGGQADLQMKIAPLDDHSHAMVRAFSSPELESAAFESVPGSARDVVSIPVGRPHDVIMATHAAPDANRKLGRGHTGHMAFVRRPARRLIIDSYLHRDLATDQRTGIATYAWHPGMRYDPLLDKDDELPCRPRLELLGEGLARADSSAWPRHAALTAHLFELAGWDPSEFCGFRCDEAMPLWNSVYIMTFDYR